MRATFAGLPGADRLSEDWALVAQDLAVVLDGATARTDTGCVHGVAWYTHRLGAAIVGEMAACASNLTGDVVRAIDAVARRHPQCDLTHPGTPSAAVGIIRVVSDDLEYFVLGDVTVAIQTTTGVQVIVDDRVSSTAEPYRSEAARLPIGTAEKAQALLRMKHSELAARNRPGGYWVAANDPVAAEHALTGRLPLADVQGVALLTDGAARAVGFELLDWPAAMAVLSEDGPEELIRRVRAAEEGDPHAERWPRNKRSDDATAVYWLPPPEITTREEELTS